MPKISKWDVYHLAIEAGVNFNHDFYQTPTSLQGELHDLAKLAGYRKPQNANGSTARYFFYHLQKLRNKHGWK